MSDISDMNKVFTFEEGCWLVCIFCHRLFRRLRSQDETSCVSCSMLHKTNGNSLMRHAMSQLNAVVIQAAVAHAVDVLLLLQILS